MSLYIDYYTIEEVQTDAAAIKNSIRNILFTPRGSMPGFPEFGSDLFSLVFAPGDHVTEDLAKRYVREALTVQETRITIKKINIINSEEFNKIIIDIKYDYRDSGLDVNDQISLSFKQTS